MLGFLFPVLMGTLLGFLAGMGVGGGSLLLLWLTQVVRMPHAQARILNLLFYLPAALTATVFRSRKGGIRPDITFPALAAGCTAAVIATLLGRYINVVLLRKLLGGLLILTGIREITYRPRKAR